MIDEQTDRLQAWTELVCAELGVDAATVDRALILDLARDVAHGVARPAAPLTAFLVGLAAGRVGGGPDDIARAVTRATDLAAGFGQATSSSPE